MSDSVDIRIVLEILECISAHGVEAVKEIIETWKKQTVTQEDVERLRHRLKRPDEY